MLKEQFKCENFGLVHDRPKDFSACCWKKSEQVTGGWVTYRMIVMLFFLCSLLYSIIFWITDMRSEDKAKFLIYLTYWTFFLETCLFFLGFLVAVLDFANRLPGTDDREISPLAKAYWVVYTVVLPCAVMVTVVFWSMLNQNQTESSLVNNIILHALNSLFILIDFCLIGVPFRFLHFYMPYVYLGLYLIFSLIYEFSGGTGSMGHEPIYPILDWKRHPGKTAVMVMLCAFMLLCIYIFFSFMYVLKLWLVRKYILPKPSG